MIEAKTESISPVALDHAMNPRRLGKVKDVDGHGRITGPCGDTMDFWITVRNETVAAASFVTDGCGATLACGSMTATLAEGREIAAVLDMRPEEIVSALGGLPPEYVHCAELAVQTLQSACEEYFMKHARENTTRPSGEKTAGGTPGRAAPPVLERKLNESDEDFADRMKLQEKLHRIGSKIIVLSGKGGVGKSTVAVNLAASLALSGKRVGLLDVDVHGPSIPTMLGLEKEKIRGGEDGMIPLEWEGLKVMSLGFLLRNPDDAVIWRGPMKANVIKQFLKDVAWGDLDFLVVDSPPGTGDEPLSVCQLIGRPDGAMIVTTPQKVAAVDVRKSITFCRQLGVPVLGVVENMSGFACPKCGEVTPILGSGGGRRIAEDMGVPFLGSIPIDPKIAEGGDGGRIFVREFETTPTAGIMRDILLAAFGPGKTDAQEQKIGDKPMKIAIPLANGRLSMHFGHCERFALVEADPETKKIIQREDVDAPPHEPGLLPAWLAERGANVIIAGGMGGRALGLFAEQGIRVVVGASAEAPEKLVEDYLAGTLRSGDNVCDH